MRIHIASAYQQPTTTTTIIPEGADPLRPAWRHPTEAGLHGQARNTLGSFPPWVHPIPASRPMSSGHFMCMALPPTEMIPDWRLGW